MAQDDKKSPEGQVFDAKVLPEVVNPDWLNGWHYASNAALAALGSIAAQIGLDIKGEMAAIDKKIVERFTPKK